MDLKKIYRPIRKQLDAVEDGLLLSLPDGVAGAPAKEILRHFFRIPGKRLRPALALLSAGIIQPGSSEEQDDKLVKLAVALELLHSASLIHDDVIDEDLFRRAQKTLNHLFGKKMAVLAGDLLYARAFSRLAELPPSFAADVVRLTEEMCTAEIRQAQTETQSKEAYLQIIQGKTADFMALCCRHGALIAGADDHQAKQLEQYGLNFGMVYQLVDDLFDADADTEWKPGMEDIERYADDALMSLATFSDSAYKQSLEDMIDTVLASARQKAVVSNS